MKELSVFDVIGPKMIGPSSSHTAGAVRIAAIARAFMQETILTVEFTLLGSFAATYKGHGTDRALVGGILGYDTDDLRIRDSFAQAKKQGIAYSFVVDTETQPNHANTVWVHLTGQSGKEITVVGVSLGGGEIEIQRINGIEVQFRGEYCTLLVLHTDRPGVVAYITQRLSDADINIAFMKLYREGKGDRAYTIIETDDQITGQVVEAMTQHPHVQETIIVGGW